MSWDLVVVEATPTGLPGRTTDEIWRTIKRRTNLDRFPSFAEVEHVLHGLRKRGTVAKVTRPPIDGAPAYSVWWRPVQTLTVSDPVLQPAVA